MRRKFWNTAFKTCECKSSVLC